MRLSLRLLPVGLLLAASVAPLTAQTTHTVTLTGIFFTPADLTIEVGDTVVWDNVEGIHNVNGTTTTFPDNPEGFGNAVANAPWTFSHTFDTAGDYDYQCDVHLSMGMVGTITVTSGTAVEDDLPPGVSLSDPSPNPFRGETAFTLTMATPEPVRVAVYDALGREVAVLHDGPLSAGTPVAFVWAPAHARAGIYVVRVMGTALRATRKVVLVE